MDIIEEIEVGFRTRMARGAFDIALARWRGSNPELIGIADIETLVNTCRDPQASRRMKDAILRALCLESQRGDDEAKLMLCWLLLPGLNAASRSWILGVLGPDDLWGESIAGMWTAAARVTAETQDVAARLVNAARRQARAAVRDALGWMKHVDPAGEAPELEEPTTELRFEQVEWAVEGWSSDPEELLARAVDEQVISATDAEILIARRCNQQNAATWNLKPWAAHKRRQRAVEKLIAWLQRTFPDSSAPSPSNSP